MSLFKHFLRQKVILNNRYTAWQTLAWLIITSLLLTTYLYVEYKADNMYTIDGGPLSVNRVLNPHDGYWSGWCGAFPEDCS